MKKIILAATFLLCLVVVALSQTRRTQEKDWNLVSQIEFKGKAISALAVGGAFDVNVYKSSSVGANYVEFRVSEEVMPYVEYNLSNGRLTVKTDLPLKYRNGNYRFKYIMNVYLNDLTEISASGATDFNIEDAFRLNRLAINCSGSSDVFFRKELQVDGDFRMNTSGSSDARFDAPLFVKGRLDVQCSGSSDVIGTEISCGSDAKILASGSSDYRISRLEVVGNADIGIAGSSDFIATTLLIGRNADLSAISSSDFKLSRLEIGGTARIVSSGSSGFTVSLGSIAGNVQLTVSGSSDFKVGGVQMRNLSAVVGGSSLARVNVLDKIDLSISGSSDFYYKRNPNLKLMLVSGSKSASIVPF